MSLKAHRRLEVFRFANWILCWDKWFSVLWLSSFLLIRGYLQRTREDENRFASFETVTSLDGEFSIRPKRTAVESKLLTNYRRRSMFSMSTIALRLFLVKTTRMVMPFAMFLPQPHVHCSDFCPYNAKRKPCSLIEVFLRRWKLLAAALDIFLMAQHVELISSSFRLICLRVDYKKSGQVCRDFQKTFVPLRILSFSSELTWESRVSADAHLHKRTKFPRRNFLRECKHGTVYLSLVLY